ARVVTRAFSLIGPGPSATYTLSLHDALPIWSVERVQKQAPEVVKRYQEQLRERVKNAGLEMPGLDDERLHKEIVYFADQARHFRSEEHTSELQSRFDLVCRLLLEKKNQKSPT